MEKVDITIIGAGIVGLACASLLAHPKKQVYIVEKNSTFGMETSSRNSEVIHSGLYYPYHSLKHLLCLEGSEILYATCRKENIAFRQCGKYIVASHSSEEKDLERLFLNAKENNVAGVCLVGKSEVEKDEPAIRCISAISVPSAGIVDSHGLMKYFLSDAQKKDAEVVFGVEVISIEKAAGTGYLLSVKDADGDQLDFCSDIVINCAGLDSDTIAAMAGIDIVKEDYQLHYCKGQYFRVAANKSKLVNRLVYPVPHQDSGGLGIHITTDLAGSLRLGPDDHYLQNRTKDYSIDEKKKPDFFQSAVKFFPALEENDLIADQSGIRPKLAPEGKGFRDFIIREESDKGLEGFINLIGIESPGLTASIAIARKVKSIAESI